VSIFGGESKTQTTAYDQNFAGTYGPTPVNISGSKLANANITITDQGALHEAVGVATQVLDILNQQADALVQSPSDRLFSSVLTTTLIVGGVVLAIWVVWGKA